MKKKKTIQVYPRLIIIIIYKYILYLDWKRNAVFLMSIFQTNSNYEKTIEPNKTFNEDNKDCGINISISNFDIQKDGKFILETNVINIILV